jgi:predicted amidophosphoribosyltransferase
MQANGEVVEVHHEEVNGKVRRTADAYYIGIKCDWYNPCPICQRCQNAFPSKYERCRECSVKSDYHSTDEKNLMIKRS